MKKNIRSQGTTLVEVTVATAILVVVTGAVSLALSTVFTSYLMTQQSGGVDQDAQAILSRLSFAAGQHDDELVARASTEEALSSPDAVLTGVAIKEQSPGRFAVVLEDGALTGSYTSVPYLFTTPQPIRKILMTSNTATSSAGITFQVRGAHTSGGLCPTTTPIFVGPDKTPATSFSGGYGDIPIATTASFMNPAQCVQYKLTLSRSSAETQSPEIYEVLLKK